MTAEAVDLIARTLLYEGYLLYPYRPSVVKNRQRFNFGVLYPRAYAAPSPADSPAGASAPLISSEPWQLRMECPVTGSADTRLAVSVRCLQLNDRQAAEPSPEAWHEASEREVALEAFRIGDAPRRSVTPFTFAAPETAASGPGDPAWIRGEVAIEAAEVRPGTYKLSVTVANLTAIDASATDRNAALLRSLVSAHVVLRASAGELVSLLDPPDDCRDVAAGCVNTGVWPVLVGAEGSRDCMLASPIILYDYPQIAPESAGDLFDGTEIDEILALRILTLTDAEKQEARAGDERARQILDRTEALPPEHWARLHGAVRGLRKGGGGPA